MVFKLTIDIEGRAFEMDPVGELHRVASRAIDQLGSVTRLRRDVTDSHGEKCGSLVISYDDLPRCHKCGSTTDGDVAKCRGCRLKFPDDPSESWLRRNPG